ncbi:N-acetylglucosamine-6-phosphate deacetylase [Natranaerofaba carboxydovora]|uniref:N-acetylglucosamine-6-phosphate deacetylase n=1 Tax=Natranaerofaba carboxydovora TaxID=2742683 RepID=UPI001F133BE5|nr:N-acetylglucosamine-6-phosphate deacetylase [Natranaerofaba carboxydovora]UMZ74938.1 N-acetylglucosamine-6-phosphate deacetylase [Natranaerofaba carboxydovora]
MDYALVNAVIYTGDEVLKNKAIIISGEIIHSIVDESNIPEDLKVIDLNHCNVSPGFIDLQVNGGGGLLFNDYLSVKSLKVIFDAHMRYGTTSFLPTIISTSKDNILRGIETVREAMKTGELGVVGLHLEGPYINEEKKGIHLASHIKKAKTEELLELIKFNQDVIKIITLAPEIFEEEQLKEMVKSDIIVSAGHSNCSFKEAKRAFEMGVSKVSHLFNAMSQLHSREPGLVGASLLDNKVWSSIIPDGYHVDFNSLKIAYQMKKDKIIIVTDSMPPVGSDINEFYLEDQKINCEGYRCTDKNGRLAGSALDMSGAVKNCVNNIGISLEEALRMASTYPAKIIGKDKDLGRVKDGYLADLVIFNNSLDVRGVINNGEYISF